MEAEEEEGAALASPPLPSPPIQAGRWPATSSGPPGAGVRHVPHQLALATKKRALFSIETTSYSSPTVTKATWSGQRSLHTAHLSPSHVGRDKAAWPRHAT